MAPPAPRPTRAARYVTLFPRRRVIRAPKTFSDMSLELLLESGTILPRGPPEHKHKQASTSVEGLAMEAPSTTAGSRDDEGCAPEAGSVRTHMPSQERSRASAPPAGAASASAHSFFRRGFEQQSRGLTDTDCALLVPAGLGRGTRRAATSTDYGGPVARRRRADDGEAEQTRRARREREQDVAEISRRMYEKIKSSRDPRDHVEDAASASRSPPRREDDPG